MMAEKDRKKGTGKEAVVGNAAGEGSAKKRDSSGKKSIDKKPPGKDKAVSVRPEPGGKKGTEATSPVERSAGIDERERPVITASARFVRTSPRKARIVADQIRGKTVIEARATLQLSTRGVAKNLESLLDSAVANAGNNLELDEEDLTINELMVDEAPTLKRFRPRAMGRATPIHKRTSHITISLTTFDTEAAFSGRATG